MKYTLKSELMYSDSMKNIHAMIIGSGKLGTAISKQLANKTLVNSKTPLSSINWNEIDIVIDTSKADVIENYLPHIIQKNKPLVIGSTGHTDKTHNQLKKTSCFIPVLLAPNFSYGIFLLKELMKTILLPPTLIEETHHIHKKDSPSGTAIDLASLNNSNINSIRKKEVFGVHSVIYKLFEEELTITHTAKSRDLFANGAIKALCFLYQKQKGLYTMDDVYSKEAYATTP